MVNHNFSPPLGISFLDFFPSIEESQIQVSEPAREDGKNEILLPKVKRIRSSPRFLSIEDYQSLVIYRL